MSKSSSPQSSTGLESTGSDGLIGCTGECLLVSSSISSPSSFQGKVISAWEQSAKRIEVEYRKDAERLASNLPPQINGEEILMLKKKFEDFCGTKPAHKK